MFVGGYISAAGLGLTCPEWPLCPNGVMPDDEYFIEWVHRLVAATTGVLILATTVSAWINKDAGRKIKFTSAFASALVVTQIMLGAIVIDTKLHAVLVAVHLGIGILLFAMTLLTVLFAFRIGKKIVESKI
tara:strand:+ start:1976 stop:2368 length:393 start_codon:yes stop_codon:yes gene_type:complete